MAAFDIGRALVRQQPPPPATRATGALAPVQIRQLPDGRIVAAATYRGAKVAVELPAAAGRFVSVGGTYSIAGEQAALVGGLFQNIMKVAAKIHHSKIVQGVAAGVLAAYGVPPGVTVKAMSITGDLCDKARAGRPKHQERIREIAREAEAGHPPAVAAVAAIRHRNRSDRRTRAAMDLLWRAQQGNPRSQAAIQKIEAAAAKGHPAAQVATNAMQAVLDASAGRAPAPPAVAARRAPPPPAVRARPQLRALPGRQPPPPAVSASRGGVLTLPNARVISQAVRPDGKRVLTVQVGGAGIDWLKRQFGFHRGYRTEAETTGLRDLYLLGSAR